MARTCIVYPLLRPRAFCFVCRCHFAAFCCCLKKNQSAPRPSEHPPVIGEKMSPKLGSMLFRFFFHCIRGPSFNPSSTALLLHAPRRPHAQLPTNTVRFLFYFIFLWRYMSLFPSIMLSLLSAPFRRRESALRCTLSFRMVFFHFVTTGWSLSISLLFM